VDREEHAEGYVKARSKFQQACKLGADANIDEILQDYPYLEREDILASIEYAARQTDHAVSRST
jgi:hypothetical protein